MQKIDHIGIAVTDLAQAVSIYETIVGKGPERFEDISEQKVSTAFFTVGDVNIELLAATATESPIAKFIEKNGRGGIHHICLHVDDIVAKLGELKKAGFRLIHERPVMGAGGKLVAFVHPKSTDGVLLELSQ